MSKELLRGPFGLRACWLKPIEREHLAVRDREAVNVLRDREAVNDAGAPERVPEKLGAGGTHAAPTAQTDRAPEKGEVIGTSLLDSAESARILIVDDDPAICKFLAHLLGEAGFQCHTALSGEEALRTLGREQVDAVISDLNMPGMDGMQLLKEVQERNSHLAFLVATGVDDIRVGVQAMRSGADDYLLKPFQGDAVIASLQRALHKGALEREVENYRMHLEELVLERTQELEAALQRSEQSYEDTLGALGAAIDLRDSETAGHSRRVCQYALRIGEALDFSEFQQKTLARGACLHDIGKLGVPDGILLKPGPLTAQERKLMQQHVLTGYELVKQIPFLADAAEIILNHHERYDGSGYPCGLKGEEIPLGARVFGVADTLDAMTSDRPYRAALPFEAGLEEIRRGSGSLYDPQIVRAFLRIPAETWPAIARRERRGSGMPSVIRGA